MSTHSAKKPGPALSTRETKGALTPQTDGVGMSGEVRRVAQPGSEGAQQKQQVLQPHASSLRRETHTETATSHPTHHQRARKQRGNLMKWERPSCSPVSSSCCKKSTTPATRTSLKRKKLSWKQWRKTSSRQHQYCR